MRGLLGYQSQCQSCDWASVIHLDKKPTQEDDQLHREYYEGHQTMIWVIHEDYPQRIRVTQ